MAESFLEAFAAAGGSAARAPKPAPAAAPQKSYLEGVQENAATRASMVMEKFRDTTSAAAISAVQRSEQSKSVMPVQLDPSLFLNEGAVATKFRQAELRGRLRGDPKLAVWASKDPVNAVLFREHGPELGVLGSVFNSLGRGGDSTITGGAGAFWEWHYAAKLRQSELALADKDKSFGEISAEVSKEILLDKTGDSGAEEGSVRQKAEDGLNSMMKALRFNLMRPFESTSRYINSRVVGLVGEQKGQEWVEDWTQSLTDATTYREGQARRRSEWWPTSRLTKQGQKIWMDMSAGKEGTDAWKALADFVIENPKEAMALGAETTVESLAPLIASTAVTALTRNPSAGMTTMGVLNAGRMADASASEIATSMGYDLSKPEDVAKLISDPEARYLWRDRAAAYTLTVAAIDTLSGGVAGRQMAKTVAGEMILQGITQAAMGSGGEVLGRLMSGQQMDPLEIALEGLGELMMAPVEVAGVAGQSLNREVRQRIAESQARSFFEALTQTANDSDLRKQVPTKYREIITELTKNGPVESVEIDSSALPELFQSGAVTAADLAATFPSLTEEMINEAITEGRDLVIPTADYATFAAGKSVDTVLREHMRLNGSMTSAESKQLEDGTLMEEFRQRVEDIHAGVAKLELDVEDALIDLRGQIEASGATRSVADAQAKQIVTMAAVMADRLSIPFSDFVAKYPLPRVFGVDESDSGQYSLKVDDLQELRSGTSPEARIVEAAAMSAGLGPDATNEELADALREYGGTPVDKDITLSQSVELRRGAEDLADFGLTPGKRVKTRDLAKALAARTTARWGRIARDDRSEESVERIASMMADEVEFEVTEIPEEQSARGWYSEKFQRSLDVLGSHLFPEFLSDREIRASTLPGVKLLGTAKNARDFMTALLALTSDGTKVQDNLRHAVKLYEQFRDSGVLVGSTRGGDRAKSMNTNKEVVQRLLDEKGPAGMHSYLMQRTTVSKLRAELRKEGVDKPLPRMAAGEEVPYSAALFGAKLGSFYANLMGDDGYLTMDRWWTRTFNRMRGETLPQISKVGIDRFKRLIGRTDLDDDAVLMIAQEYSEAYKDKGFKRGTKAEKAGNTLAKAAFQAVQDAPYNATDRSFMIDAAKRATKKLKARGIDISVADTQAVLWYYEKRLYGLLGARPTADISFEEAAQRVAAEKITGDLDRPGRQLSQGPVGTAAVGGDRAVVEPSGGRKGYREEPGRPQLPVRESDGKVELFHWSGEKLKTVDPEKAGSGPMVSADRRAGKKISFYGIAPRRSKEEPGTGYIKEPQLGENLHMALVDPQKLYPYFEDPDSLRKPLGRTETMIQSDQAYERAIKEAGFLGYYVTEDGTGRAPVGNVAVLFKAQRVRAFDGTLESIRDPQDITMPLREGASDAEQLAEIARMTEENRAIVAEIMARVDAALGTQSGDNVKNPAMVVAKANRPSIKANKPWFTIAHIRDTYRFKTVIKRIDDVESIYDVLVDYGVTVVKRDTGKMFRPGEWGWRIVSLDLQMPNGQLVEYYLPLQELEERKKAEGHLIFEEWRGLTAEEVAAKHDEYQAAIRRSREGYEAAFSAALSREGISMPEAEASWVKIESSLAVAYLKSPNSSGITTSSGFGSVTQAPTSVRTADTSPTNSMALPAAPSSISANLVTQNSSSTATDSIGTSASEVNYRLPNLERASPGPVEGVRDLASRYMAAAGFPVRHQAEYASVDVERATEIANLYEAMEDTPDDPKVREAYQALAKETIAQYEALQELGYTFEFIPEGEKDPYASPSEAIKDMQENKHLWVFPTTSGFGTQAEAKTSHPLLQETKFDLGGERMLVNDLFRVVHDVFGHGSEGAAFGPRGEENAWQAHVRMFSPLAARAMTTETRGQNSWVNYGPRGSSNRANPANTVFADQKTGLLPEWVSDVGQTEDMRLVDGVPVPPMLIPRTLAQKKRGSIILPPTAGTGRAPIISVFKTADLSTVLHEGAHFMLYTMEQIVANGDATPDLIEDFGALKKWWKENAKAVAKDGGATEKQVLKYLKDGTTGDAAADEKVYVGLQEQFARGHEAYLFEGKAPSDSLQRLFDTLSAWLLQVYRNIRNLDVILNDEVRGVFDRLMASGDEIARAKTDSGFVERVAQNAEQLGVSPEEWAEIVRLGDEAQDEAKREVMTEIMRPLKAARDEEFLSKKRQITEEITATVARRPANRVREWLGNDRWIGDDTPDALPTELRMDRQMLIDTYGQQAVDDMPRGKRPLWKADTGLSADEVGGWFGYDSGDAMLSDLKAAPKAADEVKRLVAERMREEFADPLTDGSIAEIALDAINGEARGRLIGAELRALSRNASRRVPRTSRTQAREIARRKIAAMPVRQAIRSGLYRQAMERAGERAQRALAAGDFDLAYDEKRKQLLNHALFMASKDAADLTSKIERKVARLKKRGTRKNIEGEYLSAIDEILDRYDFRKMTSSSERRRGSLLAYVEMMKASNRENELAIPMHVLTEAGQRPYKTLSVGELGGVYDALTNIEHTGRRKKSLLDAQSKREFDATVDAMLAGADGNVPNAPGGRTGSRGERIKAGAREFFDLVMNADTLLRKLDGFDRGLWYDAIKEPIDDAANTEQTMRASASDEIEKLYAVFGKSEMNRMAVKKEHVELRTKNDQKASFTQWELISMALNMGNADNLERLMDRDNGYGYTKAQIDYIKGQLSDREWNFAQSVWDYIDTYWSQIAEREVRQTGVAPKKVEATPVVTPHGKFAGGYYPIKYDARLTGKTQADQIAEVQMNMQAGRFGKAQTRDGHTKERAKGGGGRVLQLGMDVFHQHLAQVIHDLAFSEAVNNSWRLLQDPQVVGFFEKKGLLPDHQSLELWVQDVATGPMIGGGVFGRFSVRLKNTFTLSKLAFNLSTVMIQMTGVTQSMVVIGKVNFAKGAIQYASNPTGWINQVKDASPFMAERETTFHRDIYDLMGDTTTGPLSSTFDKWQRGIGTIGLWLMQKVQFYGVDMPTWLGAYQQGIDKFKGDNAKAIKHADRMVARAQASGVLSDRSAIERGTVSRDTRMNGFVRLFTALGSYMFAKGNIATERVGKARKEIDGLNVRSASSALSAAFDLMLLFTVEAVLYNLIKGTLPGLGGDDDEDKALAAFLAKETVFSVLSTVPVARDISSAMGGFGGGGAYGSISETVARPFIQAAQGEVDMALGKAVSNAVGLATGLPSGQWNRIMDAWWREAQGDDVAPIEYLMGRR